MTNKEKLKQQQLEIFAEACHDGWMAGMLRNGWSWNHHYDQEHRHDPRLRAWDSLGAEEKEPSYWAAEGVLQTLLDYGYLHEDYSRAI